MPNKRHLAVKNNTLHALMLSQSADLEYLHAKKHKKINYVPKLWKKSSNSFHKLTK